MSGIRFPSAGVRSLGWQTAVLTIVALSVPLVFGISQVQDNAFATNLGVFAKFEGSPLQLLLPLLAIGLGCLALYSELGHRFVAYVRPRMSLHSYLTSRLIPSLVIPFVVIAAGTALVAVVVFGIWPLIGNPFVTPSVYLETAQEAAAGDASSFTYSQSIAFGTPVMVIGYALWFGLGAAIYGAFGAACLLVIPNRVIAVIVPVGLYFFQSIGSFMAGNPYASLMYSLIPFGLKQAPTLVAATPTLMLGAAVVVFWIWIYRHATELAHLA